MKIVIAAGGTGGHVFPALAVVHELRKRGPGLQWIGTERSRERGLCVEAGIPFTPLAVAGLERKFTLKAAGVLLGHGTAFAVVFALFVRARPDAVLSFGGYVCGPVLAAAVLLGISIFIQEQNTVPGLVNRLFFPAARRVFLGMPLAASTKAPARSEVTGVPVRKPRDSYAEYPYPEGMDVSGKTIFICGGSQGARTMNRCLLDPARRWLDEGLQIVWQTGGPGFEEVAASFADRRHLFLFRTIEDTYPFYAAASVVVGRAGASTVSEPACFGVPVVMIPLPWSAENHQWLNAELVEAQGRGIRIRQHDACGGEIYDTVRRILDEAETYRTMQEAARRHAPLRAAMNIADSIITCIGDTNAAG